jgi:CRP-like cAMP-binding protein
MTFSRSLKATHPKPVWSFDRRALMPLRDNRFWQIEAGLVRTSTVLEDGTLITFGLWGPGDTVGKTLAGVNPYQIECLSSVEALSLSFMENQPLGKIVFSHLQQLQELTVIRSYKRVETMLAQLLGWLGQKFGREVVEGKLIELRLTHQDLGDILGITRVTVTRTLNQLEQQGLIERLPLHQIILRESEVWYYQI